MKNLFLLAILVFSFTISRAQTSKVIGNSVKVGKLEIAQFSFSFPLTWEKANNSCKNLGKGWRLPTRDELQVFYQNKDKLSSLGINFSGTFWSCSENNYGEVFWLSFSNLGTMGREPIDGDLKLWAHPVRDL